MAGLDSSGFVPKTLDAIRAELGAAFRAVFGPDFATDADSVSGELIGILADREADLWQLAQELYDAVFPDGASGVTLDRVCALTGVVRYPAHYSAVAVTMTGTAGTVVPSGTIFEDPGTGYQAALLANTTLAGGSASGACRAVLTGPKHFPAGAVTKITTPVDGLASVVNPLDESVFGSDVESDAALRNRRQALVHAAGGGSVDSIRAGLLATVGVSEAYVFENVTDVTDTEGVPPHAIECVVVGGAGADVAGTVFAKRAAGIGTHGSDTVVVSDSVGVGHSVSFSRPVDLPVYLAVTATYQGTPPADLADQIKAALVAYGQVHYLVASPVRASPLEAVALTLPTVVDATVFVGVAPGPSSAATIYPTNRRRAVLDTSRIMVSLVAA